MTASPQTRNYLYGKGELFFRAVGSEGYDHLGNAPAFTISLTEEKLEHFSSMSGTKTKDLQLVTQKGAAVAFTLEDIKQILFNTKEIRGTQENVLYIGVISSYWHFLYLLCERYVALSLSLHA